MSTDFTEVLDQIQAGEIEKTEQIGHVSYYMIEKTPYSFHFYATYKKERTDEDSKTILTEMLYDLRNKKYYLVRNGREVKFNLANLDLVIPRSVDWGSIHEFYRSEGAEKFLDMVSVEENKGMYKKMLDIMGMLG